MVEIDELREKSLIGSFALFTLVSISGAQSASQCFGWMCSLGQTLNQIDFSIGLENTSAYLQNNQNYVNLQAQQLTNATIALQNNKINASTYLTTVQTISQNVNNTLSLVNQTSLSNPAIYSNTTAAQQASSFLIIANSSYNQLAVQSSASAAPQIFPSANSSVAVVPPVTDPVPGAIPVRAKGTPYVPSVKSSITYKLPTVPQISFPKISTKVISVPTGLGSTPPVASGVSAAQVSPGQITVTIPKRGCWVAWWC